MSMNGLVKVVAFGVAARCTAAMLRNAGFIVGKLGGNATKRMSSSEAKNLSISVADFRKEYSRQPLDESDPNVVDGPFALFSVWLKDACEAKVIEPNAMCLSTCVDNKPTARFVLLKGFDEEGFVWYTNYQSRKGNQLLINPNAALTFWWGDLERSVRIEGIVEQVSEEESTAYFHSRPRGSQLGAWASNQSRVIANREALQEQEKKVIDTYGAMEVIPKPPHWGGYRLKPLRMEFWKGRESRIHDRLVFERAATTGNASWTMARLQP